MPTTVTKTIKSAGGDYSTIGGWEAGEQKDFVAGDELGVGECYAFQQTALVTIDGSTTDATRHMKLTVHSSARHAGIYDASGSKFSWVSSGSGSQLQISDDYFEAEYLQMKSTHASNGISITVSNTGCVLSQIIATKATLNGVISVASGGTNAILRNCIVYGGAASHGCIEVQATGVELDNCTTVAGAGYGVQSGAAVNVTLKNCYSGGNTTADYAKGTSAGTSGWTYTTCMSVSYTHLTLPTNREV